jgi:hypothetical protein
MNWRESREVLRRATEFGKGLKTGIIRGARTVALTVFPPVFSRNTETRSYENQAAEDGCRISELRFTEVICLQIIRRSAHLHGRPRFLPIVGVVWLACVGSGGGGSSGIGSGSMGVS